jgi:hypothetical protein
MELRIGEDDLLVDPGTFVYTPLPEERNKYRAAGAHSVPRPLCFPGMDLSLGLFDAANLLHARCQYFGPRGFIGEIVGPGWRIIRALLVNSDHLLLIDASPDCELSPLEPKAKLPAVCWGYGRKTTCSPRAF